MSRSCTVLALPLLLLACCALVAAPGFAQGEPGSRPHHRGEASPGKDAAQQEPGEEPLAPDETRVRAESYEETSKGHYEARGTVDMRINGMRVLADKADVFEETGPDGHLKRHLVAVGNVVFIRGTERLSGDRAELDESGKGFFLNAVGYVEPGVFLVARRIDRVDSKTYRVEGGTFSSCSQPNPRWNFSASRATIQVNDKIRATNALFKVKGVPALYVPYILYPIRKDKRSTGLLFPRFGYSSFKGFEFGTGFFWAMGRSADQTFSFDSFSKLGLGFGHDLRWTGASPSRGSLRTYIFSLNPPAPAATTTTDDASATPAASSQGRQTDYDIDWNVLQVLPGNMRATLNVQQHSDLLFLRRLSDNPIEFSNRSEHWSGSIDHDFPFAVVSAYAESHNNYFGQSAEDGTPYTVANINGRVPGLSLRRFPRQIGWGGIVFGLVSAADRYRFGTDNPINPASPPPATWERYDFGPTLSRPFRLSFLEFNPSVGWRYTHYSASTVADADGVAAIVGPPMDRRYFETSLEMRGPTFSRVFDTPGFGYSDRFKHTIGPEVSWTYRTRVDRFPSIPTSPFGDDSQLGTNEIRFGLVQRFYAKRRGPTGKPQPYEFFSWRLLQTYYVQIRDSSGAATAIFDPNYSSSAPGPNGGTEHLSVLRSRMRFQPSPGASLSYDLEYDVNFQQVRRTTTNLDISRPGLLLSANWSRSLNAAVNPAERFVGAEYLRASTTAEVWPRHLSLEGSTDYDLHLKTLRQVRARLHYSVQCCGLVVEHVRYNLGGVTAQGTPQIDTQWRFSLELANVGSIGMGSDPMQARQGLGGYR